jgi:hypothetical protein
MVASNPWDSMEENVYCEFALAWGCRMPVWNPSWKIESVLSLGGGLWEATVTLSNIRPSWKYTYEVHPTCTAVVVFNQLLKHNNYLTRSPDPPGHH